MKHLIIIGNSAAGHKAAITARELDSSLKISVISDEKAGAYSRNLLAGVLENNLKFRDIVFADEKFYEQKNIQFISGKKVEKINTNKNWVTFIDKTRLVYDALIVASGMSMSVPKCVKGAAKHGVIGFRSISDLNDIIQLMPISHTVCIWGGGLAGLQAAAALKKKRMEVKVIISGDKLMPEILDENGEEFLKNRLAQQEIELIAEKNIVDIFGDSDVKAIKLDNGKVIACDILIVNTNFLPNTKFLDESGFDPEAIKQGLAVDVFLQTKIPNIFAAGDVLEVSDKTLGLIDQANSWFKAEAQGKIAAANAVAFLEKKDELKAVYEPQRINVAESQIFDLAAVCLGITRKPDDPAFEELSFVDEETNVYKKIILCGLKIVGFVAVGNTQERDIFSQLIEQQTDISQVKDDLIDQDFNSELLKQLIAKPIAA
ncbi:MAG: FAD-dependent oxidoreductase [Candidatus Omnitrophica bacterium]|nr:FAD-dependent oxidoreductase [Candidatus Omnitrophota bacterium]